MVVDTAVRHGIPLLKLDVLEPLLRLKPTFFVASRRESRNNAVAIFPVGAGSQGVNWVGWFYFVDD